MTPKPQQESKEWFTLEQFQGILDIVRENAVYDDGDFYFKVNIDKITNAVYALEPHPDPSSAPDYNESQLVRLMQSEYDRGSAQAREKVLADLYEYAKHNPNGQGFASGVDEYIKLLEAQR